MPERQRFSIGMGNFDFETRTAVRLLYSDP
jgi:hypothetical protein